MALPERLSELITRIVAPNPSLMTLEGTNTYLVGREDVVVVDPGPDLAEHVDSILAAAADLGGIRACAVTHRHGDHLPAAIRLRDLVGCPVMGHPLLPGVDHQVERGDVIHHGRATLRALWTPGHTDDHVCYLLEEGRTLFTGDLIAGRGTVIVGPGQNDLTRYMASLQVVQEEAPYVLMPGHGPTVSDAAEKIREYIEHRRLRERQVVSALEAGPRRIKDLVAEIYVDVPDGLVAMAAHNVQAHLWKLEGEGLVTVSSHLWQLTGRH